MQGSYVYFQIVMYPHSHHTKAVLHHSIFVFTASTCVYLSKGSQGCIRFLTHLFSLSNTLIRRSCILYYMLTYVHQFSRCNCSNFLAALRPLSSHHRRRSSELWRCIVPCSRSHSSHSRSSSMEFCFCFCLLPFVHSIGLTIFTHPISLYLLPPVTDVSFVSIRHLHTCFITLLYCSARCNFLPLASLLYFVLTP